MSLCRSFVPLLLLALGLLLPPRAEAGPAPSRFFFSGDGEIDLGHAHLAEEVHVRYRDRQGRYDPAALAELRQFFRSREDGRTGNVSLRLVELIDFVADRFRPERLVLVSAYRSPEFNEGLRGAGRAVARASLHTEGMAADLQFAGLRPRKLWQELRTLQVGGVGLYEKEGFLHIDTGKPRFWEAATSGVSKDLSADNARLFARTDFDRYASVEGALIGLHSLTALPIRVAAHARQGGSGLELTPVDERVRTVDGCYVLDDAEVDLTFRVTTAAAPAGRFPIELHTCAPRQGATPERIETNPIEPLLAPGDAGAGPEVRVSGH